MLSSSLLLVFLVLVVCSIFKPKTEKTNDMFVSFSGDTRCGFTSHLEASFSRNGIEAFLDHKIERGAETFPTLLREIKQSKISVIVFSEGYAASDWCLNELVNIMKRRRRRRKHIVIPIFYGIKPSDVRQQSGNYAAAFAEHEQCYGQSAMTEAANVSGWDSSSYGRESRLVEDITIDVKKKLESTGQRT